jgi:hypothetical protein
MQNLVDDDVFARYYITLTLYNLYTESNLNVNARDGKYGMIIMLCRTVTNIEFFE